MKYLLIVLSLLLSGCAPLSFEEVQRRVAYCKLNGLTPVYRVNAFKEVLAVVCSDAQGHEFESNIINDQGKSK